MKKPTIHFVSELAGFGKTEDLTTILSKPLHTRKIIVALPTLVNAKEVQTRIKDKGRKDVKILMGDTIEEEMTVHEKILEETAKINAEGNGILIISHISLNSLKDFGFSEWQLFVDESPVSYRAEEQKIPFAFSRYAKYITTTKFDEETYLCTISDKNKKLVEELPYDETMVEFKKSWLGDMLKDQTVLTRKEIYDKYKDYIITEDSETVEDKKLPFLSINSCEWVKFFRKTTVMSANFETRSFYLLNKDKFNFVRDNRFKSSGKQCYEFGEKAKVYYVFDDTLMSKEIKKLVLLDGKTVGEELAKIGNELIGFDTKKLVIGNKGDKQKYKFGNHEFATTKVEGLNCYSDIEHMMYIAPLNPSPSLSSLLKAVGLTEEQIFVDLTGEAAHQCVLRIALRRIDFLGESKIFIPCKRSAEYIAKLLGCELIKIESDLEQRIKDTRKANSKKDPVKAEQKKKETFERNTEKKENAQMEKLKMKIEKNKQLANSTGTSQKERTARSRAKNWLKQHGHEE